MLSAEESSRPILWFQSFFSSIADIAYSFTNIFFDNKQYLKYIW